MQVFKQQAAETAINIGLKHFSEVYVIPVFFPPLPLLTMLKGIRKKEDAMHILFVCKTFLLNSNGT
jgi:hypothetical protein